MSLCYIFRASTQMGARSYLMDVFHLRKKTAERDIDKVSENGHD